ncbi:MAG TPA: S1C family serine protease [Myxococcaceae bacterium]|nr:S1C family serine protease [Myxococcaceae bacterium]
MENGSALSDAFAAIVEKSSASVVRVEARRRSPSSGIVWSSDGLLVTAQHAVEREEEIEIGFADGRTAEAKLLGRDPGSDVALLRVAATDLVVPPWSSAEPKVGHLALSVARPGRTARASIGIVSAVSGEWRSPAGGRLDRYLQTDIALQPGFSGSLLVDARGDALGMNTAGLLRGHSLAVPSETLRRVAEALVAHGRMRRAFVGLGSMPVRLPVKAARASGQESALLVIAVQPDGPADLSGVLLGDALLTLDRRPLAQVDDLIEALTEERIGAELNFRILRAGEVREIAVRAGARS